MNPGHTKSFVSSTVNDLTTFNIQGGTFAHGLVRRDQIEKLPEPKVAPPAPFDLDLMVSAALARLNYAIAANAEWHKVTLAKEFRLTPRRVKVNRYEAHLHTGTGVTSIVMTGPPVSNSGGSGATFSVSHQIASQTDRNRRRGLNLGIEC